MSEAHEEIAYTLSTDEVSHVLRLSPRHVRRMAKTGLLKAELQTTPAGRQWFFNEGDVQKVAAMRDEAEAKRERQEVANATYGHTPADDRGQPGTTEDMAGDVRRDEIPDATREALLRKLLEEERAEHAQTLTKLESAQTELREESKKAARLEGEKEGFRAGYQKVIDEQQRFIAMLADNLKLQLSSSSDMTEDDRGRPRTSVDVTEEMSEPADEPSIEQTPGETPTMEAPSETYPMREGNPSVDIEQGHGQEPSPPVNLPHRPFDDGASF